jgi:hypothetical protein
MEASTPWVSSPQMALPEPSAPLCAQMRDASTRLRQQRSELQHCRRQAMLTRAQFEAHNRQRASIVRPPLLSLLLH